MAIAVNQHRYKCIRLRYLGTSYFCAGDGVVAVGLGARADLARGRTSFTSLAESQAKIKTWNYHNSS